MTSCKPETFGNQPINLKWSAVRGDTAEILVEFFQEDETTAIETDGWEFVATAYNPQTDTVYELETTSDTGYVLITASPDVTVDWGAGYGQRVAEINFDLEVTIDDVVWTPVVGTISVVGDISGGNL